MSKESPSPPASDFVKVRGAKENNLKNVDLEIPRGALVVFTGVSGSGKSSLAFGTLYAEAQRRYLESVSPYARRLFNQMSIPQVDSIEGLPPAIALQQQRGGTSTRSSVGSVTTISNLIRMLYSRAGDYPAGQSIVYAESFSPNTPEGACPECHGLGVVYEVTERSMVPDDSLSIREKAIAAWPTAWQGQNLREILMTLGYNVDIPWRDLPKKDRDWILFTEEQPVVPVYSGLNAAQVQQALARKMEPSYMGTFTGVKRYVMQTFANSQSQAMKKRVSKFMLSAPCPVCHGKRLRPEPLSVKFAGMDIAEFYQLNIKSLREIISSSVKAKNTDPDQKHPEKTLVLERIGQDLLSRLDVLIDLGLGYLTLERSTPTLSPGELQRLRLGTQIHSNLFGVVYVLDEPSAGLHPADTQSLLRALDRLKAAGNSLFVVEHEVEIIRHADWIVDVGPGAGEKGGEILYSGPLQGLEKIHKSVTRRYLFNVNQSQRTAREAKGWLRLRDVSRNNLKHVDVDFPLGVLTSVTGVSGSGKSSLISQALVELVLEKLGQQIPGIEDQEDNLLQAEVRKTTTGYISDGISQIRRLIPVDQKPIGRTPRSNLATYTGLFDHVRKLFANTKMAKSRKYDAGRFSFNVAKGRCPNCEGEGFVMVELLFLPSVYTPCPACHGSRYNEKTLEITYHDKNIAQVLGMTVDEAFDFFDSEPQINRALDVVRQVGLGYLRLGQPATELSGGEAQRIKLATELQRAQHGNTLYILDEPTTGLHPSDVDNLLVQLNKLVDQGNTVIVIEHDMHVVANSDWVIDVGPGAGDEGGEVVISGPAATVAGEPDSQTGKYLASYFNEKTPLKNSG
ncbi:excinuclease ABC subunit UvrA [Dyadobacter fanqingshengii]|uniref:UvrABC system protein A n=1 Tax=Dyadobacter fanqingshengii TaxID=2906443 RepID=A0A9X1P9P6_9BACT|nr:excinuclease ABC subunit UvrA [Dyadobacter fanqingshengii]MCF0039913.1 excinuclease ABC subunit UvrA [Dyadobacter fanqingshengii]MCF2502586.1 excinuclease ABC subunit UvrA [Dyadobacter fanqingshengii]USJ38328.1 excinuclease ABC subunit UvrA [Dyadobacter fanqingshengii]